MWTKHLNVKKVYSPMPKPFLPFSTSATKHWVIKSRMHTPSSNASANAHWSSIDRIPRAKSRWVQVSFPNIDWPPLATNTSSSWRSENVVFVIKSWRHVTSWIGSPGSCGQGVIERVGTCWLRCSIISEWIVCWAVFPLHVTHRLSSGRLRLACGRRSLFVPLLSQARCQLLDDVNLDQGTEVCESSG